MTTVHVRNAERIIVTELYATINVARLVQKHRVESVLQYKETVSMAAKQVGLDTTAMLLVTKTARTIFATG